METLDVRALPPRVLPSEDVLFAAKASAYEMRYDDDAVAFWHKRGTGKLQVLQHRDTKLARLFGVDRKSRSPMANFVLMPQTKMVPCAQAESTRGAGNAFVAKVYDCSSGSPIEVHLALRIKAIPMVPDFLEAVSSGQRENATHESALASLFPGIARSASQEAARPSPGKPERGQYGDRSGDVSASAASSSTATSQLEVGDDDGVVAAATRPLQTSPRTSPRPGEDTFAGGDDRRSTSPSSTVPPSSLASSAQPHAIAGPIAITAELVRPTAGRATPPTVTFQDHGEMPSRAGPQGTAAADASDTSPPSQRYASQHERVQLRDGRGGSSAGSRRKLSPAPSMPSTRSRLTPPPSATAEGLAGPEHTRTSALIGPPFTKDVIHSLQVAVGDGYLTPGGDTLTRLIASAMALSDGESVVDFGCGAGRSAVCLATEYGASVTAIDEASACVEAAREAATKADASAGRALGIRVLHATAGTAPLKPASFDAALMRGLLSHARRPESVLEAAARAVRVGGVAVVADRVRGPCANAHEADCAAYASRGIILHSIEDLFSLAAKSGWRVRRCSTVAPTSDVTESLKSRARLLHNQIKTTQALGDSAGTLPALRAELAAEGGRLEAGIIEYAMIVLERKEEPKRAEPAPTTTEQEQAPESAAESPVSSKAAEASEGSLTVGGVVGAAAAVGILALGGWFVMNRTEMGNVIASAGRRAVQAVFTNQGASTDSST